MNNSTEFDEVVGSLEHEAQKLGLNFDLVKKQLSDYYQTTVSVVTESRSDRVFVLATVGYFTLFYAKKRRAKIAEKSDFDKVLKRFKPVPTEPDVPFCRKSVETILKDRKRIKEWLSKNSSRKFALFLDSL